ncbi:hypothetical protein [Streptomyces sp. NPDC088350]|uniref:hypothetical protein n=1 Tax=Streptomyces sp. NPDC088350 TaxID=3365854 RepID=UPI003827BD5F
MRIEVLEAPPAELLAGLTSLVGNICPFPGCADLPSRVVEFRDGSRGRPTMESSLLLCASHSDQAGRGEIGSGLLKTIRGLLKPDRGPKGGSRSLATRDEYLATIRDRIARGTRSLRGVYVGPLPLHPDWYFNLRDGATNQPNMDRQVATCLDAPGCETFLIFRNSPRYAEKVRELVPAELMPVLVAQIIGRIDAVYGQSGSNHMVCADTGIFHIPVILDDAVITAFRSTPQTPVGSGLLVTDPDQVHWERDAFDRIFAYYCSEVAGVSQVERMKEFVRSLLTGASSPE